MLTRISKLKNIRNYHDFNCDLDFSKKNVVYALNGSGKTNLSRFLRIFQEDNITAENFEKLKSLEAQKEHLSMGFELIFDRTEIVTLSNPTLPSGNRILVYNKEFLEENVSIRDFSQKEHNGNIQIGIVGANQKLIVKLTEDLNEQKELGIKIRSDLSKQLVAKAEELQKKTRGKISTFHQILRYENLNQSFIDSFTEFEELKHAEQNFKALNKINENDQIKARLRNIPVFDVDSFKQVISQSFKFEDIEKEVENHISEMTRSWIEIGVNFHKKENNNICPFCRQSTSPTQVIKKYIAYLDSEKAKTRSRIEELKRQLAQVIVILEENERLINQGLGSHIKSLTELLGIKEAAFQYSIPRQKVISRIESMVDYLSKKEIDLEIEFTLGEIKEIGGQADILCEEFKELNVLIDSNNDAISNVNRKLVDAGARKSILRKQMAQWCLIEFYDSSEEKRKEIEIIRKKYKATEKQLEIEKDKSPKKDRKDLIIKLLNMTLAVAGINKYQIDDGFRLIFNASEQSSFDITKETILVSDGEKSVIAFAYYLASMLQYIDKFEDLDKITLIIDDPISSTSYNYMHGIGAILKKLSFLLKDALESKRNEVPQIVVFTHNLQFYNLLISNVYKEDRIDRTPRNSYFSLFKKDGNPFLRKETNIAKMSEYMTALSRIYMFTKDEIEENIGNDLRKVLETICSFHFLKLTHDNLEKIFGREIESNLKLIADDYVHTDFNNFEDPLPTESLKAASNELITLVQEKYPSQFIQLGRN